jgi:hypothetical protein
LFNSNAKIFHHDGSNEVELMNVFSFPAKP